MLKQLYIRRFIAGLLLTVFALSVTPKKILHDVFAKHIDNYPRSSDVPCQVGQTGFNCDTDNQVAESNFIAASHLLFFPSFNSFSSFIIKNTSLVSAYRAYCQLRGPPAVI